MSKKFRYAFFVVLFSLATLFLIYWLLKGNQAAVLYPKGLIGAKQRDLIMVATLLMLIVVIPVFILTAAIAWIYRAGNKKAKYDPNWDYNLTAEAIWWGLPFIIIAILSVITWQSSHELDPFKPLQSPNKPLKIQVVGLRWKWLFIYPEQGIATVNFMQFPEKTPLDFSITSDAPMNSFWIPRLGGQIYAMPGMTSRLHLIADETGTFRGSSANLSGKGFAGMVFTAKASSEAEFAQWVSEAKQSAKQLNVQEYVGLVQPSENNPVALYVLTEGDLYDKIVMQYMMPGMELK
jgi:cytochrome o ubiquinol oxidase subunit 2